MEGIVSKSQSKNCRSVHISLIINKTKQYANILNEIMIEFPFHYWFIKKYGIIFNADQIKPWQKFINWFLWKSMNNLEWDQSFFLAFIEMSLIRRGSIERLSTIFSTDEALLENLSIDGLEYITKFNLPSA